MSFFDISEETLRLCNQAESELKEQFKQRDEITEYNQNKVLKAFIDNNVSESCFGTTTGYGYDDKGRDTLERVFAQIMNCEDAIIRHNFVSGTQWLLLIFRRLETVADACVEYACMISKV